MTRTKWITGAFWVLIFCVICGDIVRRPHNHTTTPTYRLAATQWWAGQDPYTYRNHDGFLYLPQAAMLFTPFTWPPFLAGEILWRALVFGFFAWSLIRLRDFFISRGNDPNPSRTFLFLSLLAVPSSLASLRNAQFDLPLATLLILTAAEIAGARWTWAAVWMCLALALKPLAIVPLLLFGALYWRLIPRLIAGLVIVALLPFLHWNPSFVAHEYFRCAQTMLWATGAHEPRYSDLGALLEHVGIYVPDPVKTAGRIAAALGFLGLGAFAVRKQNRIESAWIIGALSAIYLMLFNPRTETCSYVMLGPFLASLALWSSRRGDPRWLCWALGAAALGCACDALPYLFQATDRWLKPLLALLFLPVVIREIIRPRPSDLT